MYRPKDNASLRCLLEIAELSGRLMHWRLRLLEFYFEVRYKRGKANSQAYSLLGQPTLGETVVPVDEDISCFTADAGVAYGADIPMTDDQLAEAFALQEYNPSGGDCIANLPGGTLVRTDSRSIMLGYPPAS